MVSSIARRRLAIFRSHRPAYYSFIVLAILFCVTLFAELLCNTRPLIVRYGGAFYFPIFQSYPETTFGGDFETEADYTDPFIVENLAADGNWAVYPLIRFRYDDIDLELEHPAPSPPDHKHWLGTDDRGRDILSRLIYGFRLSLIVGFLIAVSSSLLGILLGAIQGYLGGRIDLLGQRLTEIWSSLPELYILIILSSIFSSSVELLVCLLASFGWMGLSAYIRAEYLRVRGLDFVSAAVALGCSRPRIMLAHILPNTLTPLITFFPFRVSGAITGLTALDFLGLGVPSPTPSLGELLAQGKANLSSWWIMLAAFITLVVMISLLNFIGEGARRSMDPSVVA